MLKYTGALFSFFFLLLDTRREVAKLLPANYTCIEKRVASSSGLSAVKIRKQTNISLCECKFCTTYNVYLLKRKPFRICICTDVRKDLFYWKYLSFKIQRYFCVNGSAQIRENPFSYLCRTICFKIYYLLAQ